MINMCGLMMEYLIFKVVDMQNADFYQEKNNLKFMMH